MALPNFGKSLVDEQMKERGYDTSSEYVRHLIRRDQERARLRVRRKAPCRRIS
jgi:antitoxin ParD1/3/4